MSAHHDWDLVKKKRAKALISLSLPWWQRMMRDEDQSIKALTKQQQYMYVIIINMDLFHTLWSPCCNQEGYKT